MLTKITAHKLINPKKDLIDVSKVPITKDGQFGDVFKGTYVKKHKDKEEKTGCAIKKLKQKPTNQEDYDSIFQEITCQSSLKHPALLKLIGYYMPFCNIGKFTIVTPYMKNGSLHNILQKEFLCQAPIEWTETTRAINVFGIAAGMCYMHQQKMLHRDLKTENILLDENYYPKICDFGLSKIFENGIEQMRQATICGTPCYMAPEIFVGEGYNSKIDVFAYSIVLYELFTSKKPYDDETEEKFDFMNVINGKRPDLNNELIPEFFQKLIGDCWAHDPSKRPPFVQILRLMISAYKNGEIFELIPEDKIILEDYIHDCLEPLNLNNDPDLDF